MKSKYCVAGLVIAAAVLGACHGDGPMAPRALYLIPDCTQGCGFGDWIGTSSGWLRSLNGTAGSTLTVDVEVTDSAFHAVPGVEMRWAVVHNGGSIDSSAVRSDSAGVLRVHWTLDTVVRSDSLIGRFPSGDSVLVIAAVAHGTAAAVAKVSGDSQAVAVGATPGPFTLRITDRYGNPVPGVRVAWTVGGLGSVTALTTSTGADGTSSNTIAVPVVAGVYAVIATTGTLPAIVFRVDAH